MEKEERELYEEALAEWGYDFQVLMAVEEMAEAIKALLKLGREGFILSSLKHAAEEIADVRIMLNQIEIALEGKNASCPSFASIVEDFKQAKLKRLRRIIDDNNSH